jgi:hypothetical protein
MFFNGECQCHRKNIVKVMEDKMINGIEKFSNVIISRASLQVIEMEFSDRYSESDILKMQKIFNGKSLELSGISESSGVGVKSR